MGSTLRFVLRLFVVPLGVLAAVVAATLVAEFANWNEVASSVDSLNDPPTIDLLAFIWVTLRSAGTAFMLVPGLIGVVVSEALAIRNIIVHAFNGALSIWIGWTVLVGDQTFIVFNDPKIVLAAGTAAGFAYWVVAGWSAGFWKPVFGNTAV